MADPSLTPGEQLVWAAAYAQYIIGGSRPADAARHATTCAVSLRDITPEAIALRSKTNLSGEQTIAALEQMRGGEGNPADRLIQAELIEALAGFGHEVRAEPGRLSLSHKAAKRLVDCLRRATAELDRAERGGT